MGSGQLSMYCIVLSSPSACLRDQAGGSINSEGTVSNLVERGTVRVKCLVHEHNTQCPQPGPKPGPLTPESSGHLTSHYWLCTTYCGAHVQLHESTLNPLTPRTVRENATSVS